MQEPADRKQPILLLLHCLVHDFLPVVPCGVLPHRGLHGSALPAAAGDERGYAVYTV